MRKFAVLLLLMPLALGAQQPPPPAANQSADQKDAAQLADLAKQLKQTVSQTSKYELSIKFLKQAKQIEDLARTMRTRKPADSPAPTPSALAKK